MTLLIATDVALVGRLEPTGLTLAPGTLTALVGPNGSGKTSLLHGLARIGAASGTVRVIGDDLAVLPPAMRTKRLSFLPASLDLTWAIGARDLVALSGAGEEAVEAAMARLELGAFAERRADLLSTGERSRVLLARALAPKPAVLLLDEPTANLDPLWQLRLLDLLGKEVRGRERAAMVALHDLDAALLHADRLIVMHHRRIVADGTPEEILRAGTIERVFGVARAERGWRAVIPAADR